MGNGWQTISLTFDETEIGFLASYIGDCPLSSLITLVARIDASTEDEEETIKRHTEWYQEPGAIQFIVESDGTIDNITIKKTSQDVLCVDFDVEEMENPEETFHFQVRHKDLRNAVIAEATAMLKEFGIQGYNKTGITVWTTFLWRLSCYSSATRPLLTRAAISLPVALTMKSTY